ncbi:hypothetical protein [Psychrobacillus sp. L3]|uniref:hypothetical protein n=1 Tax=Psychrobacillus sp. L3 TaxID=3236891 RepID=UPI0036F2A251
MIKQDSKAINYKQIKKLTDETKVYMNEIGSLHKNEMSEEDWREYDDLVANYNNKVAKLKIKPETMYSMLHTMLDKKDVGDSDKAEVMNSRLLNSLYISHTDLFINCFIKKSQKL